MKLFILFALICAVYCYTGSDEIKEEDNVVVITAGNWDKVVTKENDVLVEFYVPRCDGCKDLAPEYAKAAAELKREGSEVFLAKVDVMVETKVAEKYEIQGYHPIIKFFKKGRVLEYSGGHTADEIVTWLSKVMVPAAQKLLTAEDVTAFIKNRYVAVIGFFSDKESDLAKAYIKAANLVDDLDFAIAKPSASGDLKVTENKIVLVKTFDDFRADYAGAAVAEDIIKFVRAVSRALVTEFSAEAARKIFSGDIKSHLLLFISKKADTFEDTLDAFTEAAKSFKGKVRFVYIDIDVEDSQRSLEFFGLKPEDCPTVRLISSREGYMTKYVPEEAGLDVETLREFVQKFLDGKLKPHWMTEHYQPQKSGKVHFSKYSLRPKTAWSHSFESNKWD